MSQEYKYYGVRGQRYVHKECWPAYEVMASRYDAQGQCVSRPSIDSQLVAFRGIQQERCMYCNRPLLTKPPKKLPTVKQLSGDTLEYT